MPYKECANILIKSNAHTLVYAINKRGEGIYFFGGFRNEPRGNAIYVYSLELNEWSPITPDGDQMPVESTTKIVGVTDNDLKTIYIFDNGTMYIYNAFENFLQISANFAPYKIYYYATVMLNADEIAYIGGSTSINETDRSSNIPMNQILLYNTKNASGVPPQPRQGHSASMAIDGRIFIYGGFSGNENADESIAISPMFAVLEYINGEFMWSSPQLYGQLYQFRIYHNSHIFGNYLIVAFGRNLTKHRLNTIDLINISDRNNYKVDTDYTPPGYVPPTPSSSASSGKGVIIPLILLGSVGFLVIVIGCTFFIRRRQHGNVVPNTFSLQKPMTC
ncbi:hypothetical protein RclHR1_15030003 [Rhizophagus clarus]|uniref:Kelch repeat protein n=1 Tax=Rhizophagus clarus TaxID=94130 RepID=A0A2Z6QTG5_9GLOM|nr:hypothetical protein RclHR1_15030003 [Rhizophagus clarus]